MFAFDVILGERLRGLVVFVCVCKASFSLVFHWQSLRKDIGSSPWATCTPLWCVWYCLVCVRVCRTSWWLMLPWCWAHRWSPECMSMLLTHGWAGEDPWSVQSWMAWREVLHSWRALWRTGANAVRLTCTYYKCIYWISVKKFAKFLNILIGDQPLSLLYFQACHSLATRLKHKLTVLWKYCCDSLRYTALSVFCHFSHCWTAVSCVVFECKTQHVHVHNIQLVNAALALVVPPCH